MRTCHAHYNNISCHCSCLSSPSIHHTFAPSQPSYEAHPYLYILISHIAFPFPYDLLPSWICRVVLPSYCNFYTLTLYHGLVYLQNINLINFVIVGSRRALIYQNIFPFYNLDLYPYSYSYLSLDNVYRDYRDYLWVSLLLMVIDVLFAYLERECSHLYFFLVMHPCRDCYYCSNYLNIGYYCCIWNSKKNMDEKYVR